MQTESIQLHLNSKVANYYNNGSYLSDLTYYLPIINVPDEYQIHLSVLNAVIPYSFYNITSDNNTLVYNIVPSELTFIIDSTNNIFNYTCYDLVTLDYGFQRNITIPVGTYTITELVAYFNAQFLLPLIPYPEYSLLVATYNSTTKKITFTTAIVYEFRIFSTSTCLGIIGFASSSFITSANNTHDPYFVQSDNHTLTSPDILTQPIWLNTITITEGNYNVNQLVKYFNTQLVLPLLKYPTYGLLVASYDIITNKITFTNSTYEFRIYNTSTCLDLIGFTISDTYLESASKTLSSTDMVNLSPTQCLCISTNYRSGCINLNETLQNRHNIICSIPITELPFSLIKYSNTNQFKVNLYTNLVSNLNIMITDQDGNPINFNNKHWSLTLQMDFLDFINEK